MKRNTQVWIASGVLLCSLYAVNPSEAQIVPDDTLPNDSKIVNQDNTSIINGGTQAGSNLFHSFEKFSVPMGGTAYFNNNLDIQNIFSRVTGLSSSNIDGIIKANGTANLFLLNPNGILFGPNAKLDIGGSFLGTTANSINFADGLQFSATASQATQLLTVSVPIGLGFGSNSGQIRVLGNGHDVSGTRYQPTDRGNSSTTGLRVKPNKTLAIVGGDVSLEGGILSGEGGRIELGSVGSGQLSLNPSTLGWSLGYEKVPAFKDIKLSQLALVDASGIISGSIHIQARKLYLSDNSLVLLQNQGTLPSGTIEVNASESLETRGFTSPKNVTSGIWSETLFSGDGGKIIVSTPELNLKNSGLVFSATLGTAKAADITLSVPKSMQVINPRPGEEGDGTFVGSLSLGSGQAGNINIFTGKLKVTNGATITSSNVSPFLEGVASGRSGNININATDLVEVEGNLLSIPVPSSISAATFSNGSAGNVTINTDRLRVSNGGVINSVSGAFGDAGNVVINASSEVEVKGAAFGLQSSITSSTSNINEAIRQRYDLPPVPTGATGSVIVNTPLLKVSDGGQIAVNNDGTGNAGKLQINADSIKLSNAGSLTATTASGEGGDIFLRSQNLQLRRGSSITATASGTGNGGNITINTDTLAALENSDITANAFQGRGGNIQINTQGLFLSPDSNITASSQFGVDGVVDIHILGFDAKNAITPFSPNLISTEQVMAGSCLARRNVEQGRFVVTGSGGLPISPFSDISQWENLTGIHPRKDERLPKVQQSNTERQVASVQFEWKVGDPIVEAQGIIVTADGRTLLGMKPQHTRPSSVEGLVCGG